MGPRAVALGVGLGFLLLGGTTLWLTCGLQARAVASVYEERGREVEADLSSLIQRYAEEEYRGGAGGERFGERLVAAAESTPAVLALSVHATDRTLIRRFARDPRGLPCALSAPLDRPHEGEHAAGEFSRAPVGCRLVPVAVDGVQVAAVMLHLERDWCEEGERVGAIVRATALRLAPVFGGFYLLLGALLIAASHAARRWRARATAAGRIEALGATADGINHEIRNPLNAVSLALQFLERRHPDEETREVVETARREAARIASTLDEFARFTRLSRLALAEEPIGRRFSECAAARGVPVEVEGEARAEVDHAKLDDAFDAMLDLLGRHVRPGERVRATVGSAAGRWKLRAEAAAPSLEPAAVDHLFDPYVRCRAHDIGRGLALARAVFQAHGGRLVAARIGDRLVLEGEAPTTGAGGMR